MRLGLAGVLAAVALCACACGSSKQELAPPPKVTNVALQSRLMGRQLYEVLVTPAGGGHGRPLLVFLHGYGEAPSDTLSPAFVMALRRLGDRAPVVVLPEGDTGWWHDRDEGSWGSYVLREVIPAALRRSGADREHVAIGGISMGGFGALDLGRLEPERFCAVGGHSPALLTRDDFGFGFDNAADYARHDLLSLARSRTLYASPVWIDVGNRDQLRPAAAKLARSYATKAPTSASTSGRESTTAATGTHTSPSTCASTRTPASNALPTQRTAERRGRGFCAGLGRRPPQSSKRRTTIVALWPPKPNEFETAVRTSASRDSFGM